MVVIPHRPDLLTPEEREEIESKCHALWLLNGHETEEWNGMGCDCEWIQGNLNCKLNGE